MEILPQLVINSLIAGSFYALVALGFNLIYGATRFFNLAHGIFAVIGGYTVFYFFSKGLLDWPLAVLVGVLVSGLLGFLLDKVLFFPLRRRKASNMVLLVASLGAFTALQAILAILFTSQFQTLNSLVIVYDVFGGTITLVQLVAFILSILSFVFLFLFLKFTRFGKAVRAVSDDEEVAKIVGINTDAVIGKVFFIGSALAGLAGILVGFDTGIEPTMGLGLLLKGVIASIVGGVGSISGAFAGAFLLGFVENFGIWQISGEWKDAIAFLLLIIFLIFRPQGIFKK